MWVDDHSIFQQAHTQLNQIKSKQETHKLVTNFSLIITYIWRAKPVDKSTKREE